MKRSIVAVVIAGACLAVACSKGPEGQDKPARGSTAVSPRVAAPARDACALLSAAEATEIVGIPIERVEKTTDGCAWYANAAVQREKATADVGSTFEKLNKQEPATAEEGVRHVETMLKGFIGAARAGGPLFAVSVQSENADQGEALLKGTIAVVGGGAQGGRLEPIEGLGDRAYMGPVGSFLLVRKGPVLLNLGLSSFSGTREQAIALARRMVSRL